jgi:hypothetical protein
VLSARPWLRIERFSHDPFARRARQSSDTRNRTVNTPTDLSGTGAPAHAFDTIYDLGGAQPFNVATAAPGDAGYNGGRWMVHAVSFADYEAAVAAFDANGSGDFDNDEEVAAVLAAEAATDEGVVKSFVCPVIRLQ